MDTLFLTPLTRDVSSSSLYCENGTTEKEAFNSPPPLFLKVTLSSYPKFLFLFEEDESIC